ncbi:MAG: hypothetical protein MZU97_01940 [Bacillus subtilis]|nr:hypothetical protein [Bacillus subtilis]
MIKVTVSNILNMLYEHYPLLFDDNDRILCDVFDDIAILNGKPADELPLYWSILRYRYDLLRQTNKILPDKKLDEFESQMKLQLET